MPKLIQNPSTDFDTCLAQLLGYTYTQALYLGANAGSYMNGSFGLSPGTPTGGVGQLWVFTPGTFSPNPTTTLRGYYIWRQGAPQCWQAVNTKGPLAYWNPTGKPTTATPQDWELFRVEQVDATLKTVRFRSVYDNGGFVNYDGTAAKYTCSANDASGAAAFNPVFYA